MWQHDILNYAGACCLVRVFGQEISDAGQPDPPNQPEAKYPSGVAGFSLVCFTHTYIYMYSTGVWAEISTVNLHTFNAIAFYCNHSHRPQCRYCLVSPRRHRMLRELTSQGQRRQGRFF